MVALARGGPSFAIASRRRIAREGIEWNIG